MWIPITKASLTCQKYVCTWCGPVGSGLNYSHNNNTYPLLDFLSFQSSPLGSLYRDNSNCTTFQSFLWSALFQTHLVCPLISYESQWHVSLNLLPCNAILSFWKRRKWHGAKYGEYGECKWQSFCLSIDVSEWPGALSWYRNESLIFTTHFLADTKMLV